MYSALMLRYNRIPGIDGWCCTGLRSLYHTAGTAIIGSDGAGRIGNPAIGRIISASNSTLHTGVGGSNREILSSRKVILRIRCAIKMRLCGECGTDAKDDCKRHDGPFDLFHTKLFLFLVIDM